MALRQLLACSNDDLVREFVSLDPNQKASVREILSLLTTANSDLVVYDPINTTTMMIVPSVPSIRQWGITTASSLLSCLKLQPIPRLYLWIQQLPETSQQGTILRRLLIFNLFRTLREEGHRDGVKFIYGRRKRVVSTIKEIGEVVDGHVEDNLKRLTEIGQTYSHWINDFGLMEEVLLLLPTDAHEDT